MEEEGIRRSDYIDPNTFAEYPRILKKNLADIFLTLKADNETHYVKSLLDPFHP